jgi:Arc/MetJ-type ribon-helix-helix transcriptional regulator
MTTLAVRLPDPLLEALDALVADGRYPNRTAAVRGALQRLIAEERRSAVDRAIAEGYARTPSEPPDETVRALVERSVRQEAW